MREGWIERRLKEICEIKPPKSEARTRLNEQEFISFLPMEDLGIMSKEISTTKTRILKDVINQYTYFADNDILLAKITPCFENGKIGIARNLTNGIGFGSSEYFVLRCGNEIIPECLFYFLLRDQFRSQAIKSMTGAVGHRRVAKEFMENCLISFPRDPHEQRRIVHILDEAFAKIKNANESIDKNLRNANELFESYKNELFSNSGSEFEEITLSEVCEKITQGPNPKYDKSENENFRVLKTKNLYDKQIFYEEADRVSEHVFNTCISSELKNGDVLLAIVGQGSINKCNVFQNDTPFKYIYTRALGLIRTNKSKLNPYFLRAFLQSNKGKNLIDNGIGGTSGQQVVTTTYIKSLKIPLPNLEVQNSIVSKFDKLSIELKKVELLYQQKTEKLDSLKKTILQKAFTGELTHTPELTT